MERHGSKEPRLTLLAIVLFGAACATFAFAVIGRVAGCSDTCSQRHDLLTLQATAAGFGLVPAGLMLGAAVRGVRRDALLWLFVGVICYAGWAIVVDAYVHGWGDLMLLPFG